jgi:hypothetical protein
LRKKVEAAVCKGEVLEAVGKSLSGNRRAKWGWFEGLDATLEAR